MKNLLHSPWIAMTLAVLMLSLTGCRPTDQTPLGAVSLAHNAVQADDVYGLRDVLRGEALERFGNAAGLAQLKKEYAGYRYLSNRSTLLGSDYYRGGRVAHRYYSVEVTGQNPADRHERALTADVTCRYTYTVRPVPGPPNGDPMPDRETTHKACRISRIAL